MSTAKSIARLDRVHLDTVLGKVEKGVGHVCLKKVAIIFPGHMTDGRSGERMGQFFEKAESGKSNLGRAIKDEDEDEGTLLGTEITQRDTKGHKGTEEDRKGQHFWSFFFWGMSLLSAGCIATGMTEITLKHTKTHKCTTFPQLFFLFQYQPGKA